VNGLIALHGGGESLPGDEPFLVAVLEAASATGDVGSDALRALVVPTAAAHHRPDEAAANGVAAIALAAEGLGLDIEASVARIVDSVSAGDPAIADRLAEADLIHLPGGDPHLIPSILAGSATWDAIRRALDRGAVLAGASAGAMAFAELTWTPAGLIDGLGLVRRVIVLPHADASSWSGLVARYGLGRPGGTGLLGLAERTALIGRPGDGNDPGGSLFEGGVVGEGEVRWLPGHAHDIDDTVVARSGERLSLSSPGPRETRAGDG